MTMATRTRKTSTAGPLLELDTDEGSARDVPMEPLIKRDGVVYSIPVKVSADVALQYMELAVTAGPGYALAWGLQKLLGPEGYRALATFPNLTDAELGKVTDYVQKKLVRSWEFPKA
jgi:hypothetical protein